MHRINDVYETVLKLYLNGRKQKKNSLYCQESVLFFLAFSLMS